MLSAVWDNYYYAIIIVFNSKMALKLFRVSTFLFLFFFLKYITTFSQKGHIKLIKSGRKDIYNITKFAYFDYYEL